MPETLDDGWKTSSLEAEGLSAAKIADLVESVRRDPHEDFKSLLVARDGRLAFEAYFHGHGRDVLHDIRSATKSFTSALVGIAIEKGFVPGLDARAVPMLPSQTGSDGRGSSRDDRLKESITVEHLLTMASGLDANDDDPASPGNEDRLWESADWVRFALELPMAGPPGRTWSYASVNTFLLGVVVEAACGKPLSDFAREHLFGPLGITEYHWASNPTGQTVAQGNLSLRARDMAKLGQLYLTPSAREASDRAQADFTPNAREASDRAQADFTPSAREASDRAQADFNGGLWTGRQVVPESWIRASVLERYPVPWEGYGAYGYGWFLDSMTIGPRMFRYFLASGNGGNKIYVLPGERMVVAIQSAAYGTGRGQRRSRDVLKGVLAALDASR